MSASQELIEAVRARVADTPYRLEETADGFDVGVDLADAKYYTLMYQKKLEKTFTYRVKLDEASKTMSITDDSWELSWKRGADVSGGKRGASVRTISVHVSFLSSPRRAAGGHRRHPS